MDKYKWSIILGLFEVVIIILFGIFGRYQDLSGHEYAERDEESAREFVQSYYPFFQDIHVMMFVGFGYLMTFLRKYSWSAVSFTFVLSVVSIQWTILTLAFWRSVFSEWKYINLSITWLIEGDFGAASILIAMGALLGKTTHYQLLIMSIIFHPLYSLNYAIGGVLLNATDAGGSMYIHTFGACFGLAVTLFISKKERIHNHPDEVGSYTSNLFSFIGTIFLWMYWPSFNAGLLEGVAKHRAVINTVLSLTGSCFSTFIASPFFRKGKHSMEDVINATLSGGVAIGASADLVSSPYGAILIGVCAGLLTTFCFEVVLPYLKKKSILFDTCGILGLHCLPGILGGFIAAIIAGNMSSEDYRNSTLNLFPKLVPRPPSRQMALQFAALFISIGIGILGGLVTGFILNYMHYPFEIFRDSANFIMEEDENEPMRRQILELMEMGKVLQSPNTHHQALATASARVSDDRLEGKERTDSKESLKDMV